MIDLTAQSCTGTVIATLKELLAAHKGSRRSRCGSIRPGRAAVRRRHLPRRTRRRAALRAAGPARHRGGPSGVARTGRRGRPLWRPASPRPPGSAWTHATRGHPGARRRRRASRPRPEIGQVPATAFGADPLAAANAFVDAAPRACTSSTSISRARARSGTPTPSVSCAGAVQASGGSAPGQVDSLLGRGPSGSCSAWPRCTIATRRRCSSGASATGSSWGSRRTATVRRAASTSSCRSGTSCPGWPVSRSTGICHRGGRAGGLQGPDLDAIGVFAESSPVPVVVAGGIRGVDDLRAVAALDGRIEGAVVGRALYEGLDLRAAIAAVA